MTLHTPMLMQPAGSDPDITYTGAELRNWINATLVLAAGPGVQGVATVLDYQVTQRGAGANFSVDVAGGYGWVFGDDTAGQGTYFVWSDGTVNVATPSAPASGTRVHRLVLQIQDKLNNGVWSGYSAALTLLQDTGSGTPAEPNSALTLALVSIAAGQASVLNANISDQRPLISGIGPWIPFPLNSNWKNRTGTTPAGGSWAPVQYRKLNSDEVELTGNGQVTGAAYGSGGGVSSALGVLPTGFRPARAQSGAATLNGTTASSQSPTITVDVDGTVTLWNIYPGTSLFEMQMTFSKSA